jgi:hypothetical protein
VYALKVHFRLMGIIMANGIHKELKSSASWDIKSDRLVKKREKQSTNGKRRNIKRRRMNRMKPLIRSISVAEGSSTLELIS